MLPADDAALGPGTPLFLPFVSLASSIAHPRSQGVPKRLTKDGSKTRGWLPEGLSGGLGSWEAVKRLAIPHCHTGQYLLTRRWCFECGPMPCHHHQLDPADQPARLPIPIPIPIELPRSHRHRASHRTATHHSAAQAPFPAGDPTRPSLSQAPAPCRKLPLWLPNMTDAINRCHLRRTTP